MAVYADGIGPAFRAVRRESQRIRKEAPDTSREALLTQIQERALRVIGERGRRRRTPLDHQAMLVGDIQTTKNNCFYVGIDANGDVVLPRKVATKEFAKTYLGALDNRVVFYTHLVAANVKNGKMNLDQDTRELIAEMWAHFSARFRKRR